jgi:two-component system chemotaxis sensor kinase CheA
MIEDLELLKEMVQESLDHVEAVESILLRWEKSCDPVSDEDVNTAFRGMHSIKGGFSFFGLSNIKTLSHSIETILSLIRDGNRVVPPQLTRAIIDSVDLLKSMIESPRESQSCNIDPFLESLNSTSKKHLNHEVISEPVNQVTSPDQIEPLPLVSTDTESTAGKGTTQPANSSEPQKASPAIHHEALRVRLELLDRLVTLGSELVLCRNQLQMRFEQVLNTGALRQVLEKSIEKGLRSIFDSGSFFQQKTISTAELMNKIPECKNKVLNSISFRLNDNYDFHSAMKNIDNVTSDLQSIIMLIRMQPVGRLFDKFTRVVRDLSKDLGKSINLELEGTEVELDKTILDAISAPLTHIIRNAADHGLETPEERTKSGKGEQGTIVLSASQAGGVVKITISDDGKGIDPQKISDVIVKKGLMSLEQVSHLSRKELIDYIMQPGFSTAAAITEYSGRGVGLDVVRSNIERLGGTVTIDTEIGQGSTFELTVPLTLAIIPALIIRCGGYKYAVPQEMIKEIVLVNGTSFRFDQIQNTQVLRIRDEILPVLDLSKKMEIPSENSNKAVLIIQILSKPFGLIVEYIEDAIEIVVRPIHMRLKKIGLYSGATILGDGSICMILDLLNMAEEAGIHKENTREIHQVQQAETGVPGNSDDETQILLLTNQDGGLMALLMDNVIHMEKIESSRIECIGNRWMMQYNDSIVPLLKVSELLPERRGGERTVHFESREIENVILIKYKNQMLGLVVYDICDARTIRIKRQRPSRDGVAFCAMVDNKIAEFINVERLAQMSGIEDEVQ